MNLRFNLQVFGRGCRHGSVQLFPNILNSLIPNPYYLQITHFFMSTSPRLDAGVKIALEETAPLSTDLSFLVFRKMNEEWAPPI